MKLSGLFKVCLACLVLLALAVTTVGANQVSLTRMEKEEAPDLTKIILFFSAAPKFVIDHSAHRLDLLLYETQVSPKLRRLPEDETVMKILLAKKNSDLLASLLLRRPPVHVQAEARRDPARIEVNIRWQEDQGSRPAVAFRIAGMPPRKAGRAARDLAGQSPWKDRWPAFFREYSTDWSLQLPLSYSMPRLPPLTARPGPGLSPALVTPSSGPVPAWPHPSHPPPRCAEPSSLFPGGSAAGP